VLRFIFILVVIYTIYYFSEGPPKNNREERLIEYIDPDYDKKVGR
jgi:hypothetical protein